MNLQDMTNEQLIEKLITEIFISKGSPITAECFGEIRRRLCHADTYDVYDVRIKSKQPEFTWDDIYPIPVRGESKRHAAQSTKNTHLLAIQTDAVIIVTERGMNPVTGEVFTMTDLD
jgi:hypothetical protein